MNVCSFTCKLYAQAIQALHMQAVRIADRTCRKPYTHAIRIYATRWVCPVEATQHNAHTLQPFLFLAAERTRPNASYGKVYKIWARNTTIAPDEVAFMFYLIGRLFLRCSFLVTICICVSLCRQAENDTFPVAYNILWLWEREGLFTGEYAGL